jgi:hypothetical protein
MAGGKLALCAAVVTLLGPAAAYADFSAPELFVSESDHTSLQTEPPVWQPLGSAVLHGGQDYRLGVRMQPTSDSYGREYVLLQGLTVPHPPQSGSPTSPAIGECPLARGKAGDIVEFGRAYYYGDGTYTLTAALAPYQAGPCPASGAVSTGSFTVDARPTVAFTGDPRAHDLRPAAGFRGVTLTLAKDTGLPEVRCARDATADATGRLTGSVVTHADDLTQPDGTIGMPEDVAFPHSGVWSCSARTKNGPDFTYSGWSDPVMATIPGDFRFGLNRIIDRIGPTFAFRFPIDRGAAGGTVTLRLRSCRRYSRDFRGKPLKPTTLNLSGKVDERGGLTLRFRRSLKANEDGRIWVGKAHFSGTPLVAAATTQKNVAFSLASNPDTGPTGIWEYPAPC